MNQRNYDRFLDIHIVHKGHYDFARDVESQLKYQQERHGFSKAHNLTMWAKGEARDLDANLDLAGIDQGYIAVAVELQRMKDASPQEGARQVLAWVGDARARGKIRVNVHGDGEGNIAMRDGKGNAPKNWLAAPGGSIVDWLHKNGLPIPENEGSAARRGGLRTLALAICMGARRGAAAAALKQGSSSTAQAAVDSVVRRCISSLRRYGYLGVEVTASNETVANNKGQIGRWIGIPEAWGLNDGGPGVKVLTVPSELKVDEGRRAIAIPPGFEVVRQQSEVMGAGWLVRSGTDDRWFIPESGWYVEPDPRGGWLIQPPLGFLPVAGAGGGGTITIKLQDPKDRFARNRVWLRLAHTPEKSRDVS